MPDYLLIGPPTFGFMNALVGFAGLQRARHLEAQIGILRRVLFWQWIALLAQLVLMLWHAMSTPRLAGGGEIAPDAIRAHLQSLRAHDGTGWSAIVGAVFLVLAMLPCVIHVLRGLGPFVAAHRADLLARDQAALHGSRADEPVNT